MYVYYNVCIICIVYLIVQLISSLRTITNLKTDGKFTEDAYSIIRFEGVQLTTSDLILSTLIKHFAQLLLKINLCVAFYTQHQ